MDARAADVLLEAVGPEKRRKIAPQPVRDLSALVIIEAAEHLRHDGMLAGAEATLINIDHARYAQPYRTTLRAERLAIAPHNVNFEPRARPRH